jgi:acetate---CoA ligase (ADP-forming)
MRDLTPLLAPRTVALVGASDVQNILRGRILNVMRQHAFDGQLFPVSCSCEVVQGLQAYPSVDACPEPVDLAILIIPANAIADAMRHCGQAGVKAVLVLASRFAEEPSAAGDALQAELLAIADSYGMVVSGPNTEGFSNMGAKLCATFSPTMELDATPLVPDWRTDGHVAVVAQSGGVGYSFFDRGRPKELPFSYVVTTGNEAMVESLHVVDHLIDDAATGVILIFMEDVKSPELLRLVAEKALRAGKPLIVTKIGRSEAGVRAAQSDTAAIAGDDTTYRALFRRYGILEGRDQDHMVDLAQGFSAYAGRLPAGKRVGIFTASGGGGGWLADACSDAGLTVPELDVATRATIDVHLPPYGTSQNPVDATAQTIRQRGYAQMCELIAGSPEVDAVLAVTSARIPAGWERETLLRVGRETEKPILLWAYTLPHPSVRELVSRAGLPLFENLRNCAETAAAMADYMAFRRDFLAPTSVKESPPRPSVSDILAGPTPIVCELDARRAAGALRHLFGRDSTGHIGRGGRGRRCSDRASSGP